MSGKIAGIDADPLGSAPAEAEKWRPRDLVELVAEAAANATRDALERHCPNPESAGPYVMARALRVAMNRLIGPDSADSFIMLEAGQILEEFEAKRKGVM